MIVYRKNLISSIRNQIIISEFKLARREAVLKRKKRKNSKSPTVLSSGFWNEKNAIL